MQAPTSGVCRHARVDFFDLKGDLEALFAPETLGFEASAHPALHPGRCATILHRGERIGVLGELHPKWVQKYELGTAPVVCEIEVEALLAASLPVYVAISRQPAVLRDMALVVDHALPVAKLLGALNAAAPAIVKHIQLFDLYQGKGIAPDKKSLAFRVLMQDTQRTLEDAEVDAAVATLLRCAQNDFDACLRG